MTSLSGTATGYIAATISILFFGSNFVPVKKCEIGDGIFFQFFMCNAIFITALPVYSFQEFPPFHDIAVIGGFLWCTGNLMCGPAINLIGISYLFLFSFCLSYIYTHIYRSIYGSINLGLY